MTHQQPATACLSKEILMCTPPFYLIVDQQTVHPRKQILVHLITLWINKSTTHVDQHTMIVFVDILQLLTLNQIGLNRDNGLYHALGLHQLSFLYLLDSLAYLLSYICHHFNHLSALTISLSAGGVA